MNQPDGMEMSDLRPVPKKSMKWIYVYDDGNEKTRDAVEVEQVGGGFWREIRMMEGVKYSAKDIYYIVLNGILYIQKEMDDNNEIFYSYPGKRAVVKRYEMPFVEDYSESFLGTNGVGLINIRNFYDARGSDNLNLTGTIYTGEKYSIVTQYQSSSNEYIQLVKKEVLRNDLMGVLREESASGSYYLIGFQDNDDGVVYFDGEMVKSRSSNMILNVTPSLKDSVSEAELKELYSLANMHDECKSVSVLDLLLAQVCHLGRRYYLYQEFLPRNLDGIRDVQEYFMAINKNDPFSFYLSKDQYARMLELNRGERATIGIQLRISGSSNTISPEYPLVISRVIPYARAWFDGLEDGDVVLAINGKSMDGLDLDSVMRQLPSSEGKTVTLSISRSNKLIEIQSASEHHISKMIDNIAYLNIRQFSDRTAYYLKSDLENLQRESSNVIEKIILDLRGNPGGKLTGALQLSDYLIDKDAPIGQNPIYLVKGRKQEHFLGNYWKTNIGIAGPENFAVIVDGGSASASEITAAALKYYRVAKIVGGVTYGKGLSQLIFSVLGGAGVAFSNQENLSPDGSSYHKIGIMPDILVTTPASRSGDDPQIAAAVRWLNSGNGSVIMKSCDANNANYKDTISSDPFLDWMIDGIH